MYDEKGCARCGASFNLCGTGRHVNLPKRGRAARREYGYD